MAQRPVFQVTLKEKSPLEKSPAGNLLTRLKLVGPDLADFPADSAGDYVKFLLPKSASAAGAWQGSGGNLGPDFGERRVPDLTHYWKRTFTVRAFDLASQTLTIDVVNHGGEGPAARWVREAEPGAPLLLAGPGPVKGLDPSADWFFLVGDLSALQAIAANLEKLPSTAQGHVVVEIDSDLATVDAAIAAVATFFPRRPPGLLCNSSRRRARQPTRLSCSHRLGS